MPHLIGEEDTSLLAKETATIEETITIISINKDREKQGLEGELWKQAQRK